LLLVVACAKQERLLESDPERIAARYFVLFAGVFADNFPAVREPERPLAPEPGATFRKISEVSRRRGVGRGTGQALRALGRVGGLA